MELKLLDILNRKIIPLINVIDCQSYSSLCDEPFRGLGLGIGIHWI